MGRKAIRHRGKSRRAVRPSRLLCAAALLVVALQLTGALAQPVIAASDYAANLSSGDNYAWDGISLLCRILLTFGAELMLAVVFRFNNKNQMLFIAAVNVFTLTLSQSALNVFAYSSGTEYFFQCACVFSTISFALEGMLYQCALRPLSAHPEKKLAGVWLYALTANFVSLLLGMMIAIIIPGLV